MYYRISDGDKDSDSDSDSDKRFLRRLVVYEVVIREVREVSKAERLHTISSVLCVIICYLAR